MQTLANSGLVNVIRGLTQPVLGICLGMQLLYDYSEEDKVDCLGVIPGRIKKFPVSSDLIVPHMGWNNLNPKCANPVIQDIAATDNVYFVHSYYAPINEATVASCDYGAEFTAVAAHKNFYGMQFHPEKSGVVGAKLLANFFETVNND